MSVFEDDPTALATPWVESPFFEATAQARGLSETELDRARRFREDGYLVLEGLIPAELIDAIVARYDWLFDPSTEFEAPDWLRELFRRDANRRQDAWHVLPEVRELAAHPEVLATLQLLYGRAPIPFQTLNFLRGTQQPIHSDAMHFSSLPARFMCGVWVAFEDVDENNGSLIYHRGSHRLPEVRVDELGVWGEEPRSQLGESYAHYERYLAARLQQATDMPLQTLCAPKGSVLIWASNLAHGGGPIHDPDSTRHSQVTHYFFEDCIYYTPIFSDPALGEYFLRDIWDVRTGQKVPHCMNGEELSVEKFSAHRSRLRRRDPADRSD